MIKRISFNCNTDAKMIASDIAPSPFREWDTEAQEQAVTTAAQHMLNSGMPKEHVENVLRDLLSEFVRGV